MKYLILLVSVLFFGFSGYSQASADLTIMRDTIRIPKEYRTINAEYLITTLKSGTTIQLIKSPEKRYYLRIVTSDNLYFEKTDVLEIQSGSRSLSIKTTNYELNKNTGYYIVEVGKNYIATLKDDGITGLVFGKAETKYSKQDCIQIKQMAKFFYESFCTTKK
jgi:hypothetical protein